MGHPARVRRGGDGGATRAARVHGVAVPLGLSGRPLRTAARQTAVLTWAGMRGGISIALALTLPDTPFRPALLAICYAVVLFTIVVQGLTLPTVLRSLYERMPARATRPGSIRSDRSAGSNTAGPAFSAG
jgi:NhaP-type Na+/H+ or K+/H+ antiporter